MELLDARARLDEVNDSRKSKGSRSLISEEVHHEDEALQCALVLQHNVTCQAPKNGHVPSRERQYSSGQSFRARLLLWLARMVTTTNTIFKSREPPERALLIIQTRVT